MRQLILNGSIFTGEALLADHGVVLEGERIAQVLPCSRLPADADVVFDLEGGTLLPGFIDLQVNGGGDVLFNAAPDVGSLRTIAAAHRRFGTTGMLPTLISDSDDVMRAAIAAVEQAMSEGVPGVLGIHLEGPYLNPRRCGIHSASQVRALDDDGIALLTSLRRGRTLVTLAPECCDPQRIRELVDAGVVVSAGHTEASYAQCSAALDAGMTGFTHLYNAMSPLQSREPGAVGAALTDPRAWFGIIADGHHCHPAALRVAVRARGPGGALLVTDAMPTVGGTGGTFELDGQRIETRDGCLKNAAGTLAGSNLNMLAAVGNTAHFAGIDWLEAVRMASLYPARALGLEGELGAVRPGLRASLLALDAQRKPRHTWVDGRGEAVTG